MAILSKEEKNTLFNNLQANILKTHGREHSWCFFIEFEGDHSFIKSKISRYAYKVTSAFSQQANTEAYKEFIKAKNNYYEIWIKLFETVPKEPFWKELFDFIINKFSNNELHKNWVEKFKKLINVFKSNIIDDDTSKKLEKLSKKHSGWAEGFVNISVEFEKILELKYLERKSDQKAWEDELKEFENRLQSWYGDLTKIIEQFEVISKNKNALDLFKSWYETFSKKAYIYFLDFENEVMINFCLSYNGYRKLGIGTKHFPKDPSFKKGMKNNPAQSVLCDSIALNWDKGFRENEIDAVIIVAHDSEKRLEKSKELIEKILNSAGGKIIALEKGKKLRRGGKKDGVVIEHFNFADGKSQPVLFEKKIDNNGNKIETLLERNLNLVLVKEEAESYGSYLVFRKLEQNVSLFESKLKRLAINLYGDDQPKSLENAAAQVIGRFRESGKPLISPNQKLGKTYKEIVDSFNEYDPGDPIYDPDHPKYNPNKINPIDVYKHTDSDGLICPFHAHIRKVNPRSSNKDVRYREVDENIYGGVGGNENKLEVRIVRRGYTYDNIKNSNGDFVGRKPDLSDAPDKDVGILFMSFQASIRKQFEVISRWANSEFFPPRTQTNGELVGLDPIIGIQPRHMPNSAQNWISAKTKNSDSKEKFRFGNVITSRGGEYFYAPSISFLWNLKNM